jgi:hypothetical protein
VYEKGIAILDKSAFQGLSRAEHIHFSFAFMVNITPILGIEILSDLAKAHIDGRSPEVRVQELARKFGGSGSTVNMEFIHLVGGELSGSPVPMTGQIIPDNSRVVRQPNGEAAMIVDMGPFNYAFLRWSQGVFEPHELALAQRWRATAPDLSQSALWDELRSRNVAIPRPPGAVNTVVEGLARVVDDILAMPNMQPVWLDYMLTQIEATPEFRAHVYDRWLKHEPKAFASFAPYSHHCLRVTLAVLVSTKHNIVSQKASNFLDAQYLFYSPFCEVFISNDRLHRVIAPLVIRPNQRFILGTDLKREMAAVVAARTRGTPKPRSG